MTREEKTAILEDQKNFRSKLQTAAEKLLDKLIINSKISDEIKSEETLNILVPGSGLFPSYIPFVIQIVKIFKKVKSITITLNDLEESLPKLFEENYFIRETKAIKARLEQNENRHIDVKIKIKGKSIASLLRQTTFKFHMVYFEHPEISSIISVLTAFGLYKERAELITELPRLSSVLCPGGMVFAALKTYEELMQLKSFLEYSLDAKGKVSYTPTFSRMIVSEPLQLIFAKDFFSGLVIKNNSITSEEKLPKKIKHLKSTQTQLAILLTFCVFAYIFTWGTYPENDISFILCIATLLRHKPESLTEKTIIAAAQAILMFKVVLKDMNVSADQSLSMASLNTNTGLRNSM